MTQEGATERAERDRVIGQVVRLLYESGAYNWSVQDKGVMLAAVKLQLSERVPGDLTTVIES